MGLGWTDSTEGACACFFSLIVIAALAAIFVRKSVWAMITMLGLIAGWFFGAFLFTIIATSSGWESEMGYWLLASVFALIGCITACQFGVPVVMTLTSIVGSYLFMRAWTLFYPGHYPNESQIVSPASLDKDADLFEMTYMFWVFVSVFLVCFAFSMTFQAKIYKQINYELHQHEYRHGQSQVFSSV